MEGIEYGLETPYEVEPAPIDFIDCMVCSKSIRGDTLYKIHLTTAGHLKKEEALVAQGMAIREHTVPDFEDIVQYLKYLNLDEPIIGLNFLEEVPETNPTNDIQPGPKYLCKLCDLPGNLPNMVNHLIGRKHRQKYIELKRPDLVTWLDGDPIQQPGKVIRAKAEVLQRQDGPGRPRPMKKSWNVGKSNISRVVPKQRQKMDHNVPHGHAPPPPMDYRNPNSAPFHPNDPYMRDGPQSYDFREDEMRRPDYMESKMYRKRLIEADYDGEYQESHAQDVYRREEERRGEPGRFPRSDSRDEMPHRQAYFGDTYPEETPPHRRPHPESDPLKQFYSEEVWRERLRSAEAAEPRRPAYPVPERRGAAYPQEEGIGYSYPPEDSEPTYPGESSRDYTDYSHAAHHDERSRNREGYPEEERQRRAFPEEDPPWPPAYPEEQHHQWSLDRHGNKNGAGRPGPGDPEAKRRRFPEPSENVQPYDEDNIFEMVRALRQERAPPPPPKGKVEDHPRPGRPVPPASHRPLEGNKRSTSEIPEPFRRFLEGAAGNQDNEGKRKKKSRFSDATKEEVERAQGALIDTYRPMGPEGLGPTRPTRQTRPEVHGPQRPDLSRPPRPDPYSPFSETYPRGSSESLPEKPADTGKVFDMLSNIEIKNVEEADYLKDKLCHLLKEFQEKKSEKTVHNSQGRAVISKDYNHLSQGEPESKRSQYERALREGPGGRPFENQPRRSEEGFPPQDAPRGRDQDLRQGPDARPFEIQPRRSEERHPQEAPPRGRGLHEGPDGRPFEIQPRRSEERHPEEAPRGRGWEEQQEQLPEEQYQEYGQPSHPEDRLTSRGRYEEVFGRPPPTGHPGEREMFPPKMFQEPMHPHNYPPPAEFFGPPSSGPPFQREQGYRMRPRMGPPQASSLDKITSTLLELVARK